MASEQELVEIKKIQSTLKANQVGLVPVKFVKKYRSYNVGEIAGFSPYKAAGLIFSKIATEVTAKKKAKAFVDKAE